MRLILSPPLYRVAKLIGWNALLIIVGMALGEFQNRAERDGAALVILAETGMGGRGHARFNLLSRLAAAHSIPVISLHDYILRQGGNITAAAWAHDLHWNPQGHQ